MMISNERGVITVDYLLSMVLVLGFSFIIFALSMTLTMVEIVQYMTYSSARSFMAANQDEEAQRTLGLLKFKELENSETLTPLFESGWFELEGFPTIGPNIYQARSELSGYQQEESKNLFHGTVIYFTSHVLEFSVPFYGTTADDELRDREEFGSYIGSYLGREPTQKECESGFLTKRWEKIKALAPAYNEAGDEGYVAIADNGC